MGSETGISWTDATWNPVRGCSRVSEGCRNCYAERVAARFSGPGQAYEGLAKIGVRTGHHPKWTGVVRVVPEHLADPLRWKKPRRIFVNSMSDLFHERLADEDIATVVGVMSIAAQHTYQILTKRPERMREFFARWTVDACIEAMARSQHGNPIPGGRPWNRPPRTEWGAVDAFPLPWIWLGVSVENQDAANARIPELLATPAAVRFLSCEPLLGPVDLHAIQIPDERDGLRFSALQRHHDDRYGQSDATIDWVIAGCESGPGARPCAVAWLRSLRDQCASADVPFFLKQAIESLEPDRHGFDINADGILDEPIRFGDYSKVKGRGHGGAVIELPYLDDVQHAAFPVVP